MDPGRLDISSCDLLAQHAIQSESDLDDCHDFFTSQGHDCFRDLRMFVVQSSAQKNIGKGVCDVDRKTGFDTFAIFVELVLDVTTGE